MAVVPWCKIMDHKECSLIFWAQSIKWLLPKNSLNRTSSKHINILNIGYTYLARITVGLIKLVYFQEHIILDSVPQWPSSGLSCYSMWSKVIFYTWCLGPLAALYVWYYISASASSLPSTLAVLIHSDGRIFINLQ